VRREVDRRFLLHVIGGTDDQFGDFVFVHQREEFLNAKLPRFAQWQKKGKIVLRRVFPCSLGLYVEK